MKKITLSAIALATIFASSCSESQLATASKVISTTNTVLNGDGSGGVAAALSNEDIIAGLKQALEVGAKNSAGLASKLDGFYKNDLIKIPMPAETADMVTKLKQLGLENQVNKFEVTMNRAAEEASKEAATVFINAITGMTVQDGLTILKGPDNAATSYLEDKTTEQLLDKFGPIVNNAMNKVQVAKHWEPLASTYNKTTFLTGKPKVNPDLQGYILDRSLHGLFTLIAQEEKNIRDNPAARVTDLLQKVFGANLK